MQNLLGITKENAVDVSSADVSLEKVVRAIYADTAGYVKFDLRNDAGVVTTVIRYLPAGIYAQYSGVIIKAYRYYTGTTGTTATSFKSNGTLVAGFKCCE